MDTNAKGDFSLTTFQHLQDNAYVVGGSPQASYLIELVTPSADMPPQMPKEGAALKAEQVAVLRMWIEQGADWPAATRLELPDVADRSWWSLERITTQSELLHASGNPAGNHPVDAFVDAKLNELGIHPVEQAAAITLIRRATYDLTGLPPTLSEIDTFLQENAANESQAWQTLIDRLLASPAFGEKWAQHWLDLARYAETHGYDKDKLRSHAWPFRDYVIRSFNQDKRYSRFLQEQVAGDALFPGEPDGVLGLGFLAAGPWDFIGHWEVGEEKLDGRIAKHLDRDEMIATVFNVFMSTTVQCAQCHHHKFDPIRMEDYYRLHAVFAALDRADRVFEGLTPQQQLEKQQLATRLGNLKQQLTQLETSIQATLAEQLPNVQERMAELQKNFGAELKPEYGYHSQIAAEQETSKWVQVDLGRAFSLAEVRIFPAFDPFNNIGAGFGFPVRYRLEASNDPDFRDNSVQLWLDRTESDQLKPQGSSVVVETGAEPVRYLRVTAVKLAPRQNDFIFALAELQAIARDSQANCALGASVSALDSIQAAPRWGTQNLVDGIYYQRLNNSQALAELIELERRQATADQAIRTPEIASQLAEFQTTIAKLSSELKAFPEGSLVYAAATHFPKGGQFIATEGKPRSIHLLNRGDLRSPAQVMSSGAPELWPGSGGVFLLPAGATEANARAELASYLTRTDNPLVWRTMANRIWQWTFGQPLVGTPNDFGRMGMLPTHPELLDYLAARLRDDPQQSLKSIVRLLMTSRAYRRSCDTRPENILVDAGNSSLWRFDRRRLTAEEIRDSILAVSGVLQLDPRGGPSFQDFVIEKPEHSPHFQYHLHDPDDAATHRRSIYRFVVRSQPHPMLTALDCADPSSSVPMRDESTTALQALTQWNNRLVESMARRLAQRLKLEAPAGFDDKLDLACRLALGRLPDSMERPIMLELLQSQGEETFARVLLNTSAFTYVD